MAVPNSRKLLFSQIK